MKIPAVICEGKVPILGVSHLMERDCLPKLSPGTVLSDYSRTFNGVPHRLLVTAGAGEAFWTQAEKLPGIARYGVTWRGVLSLHFSPFISQASRWLRCLIDMNMANGTGSVL